MATIISLDPRVTRLSIDEGVNERDVLIPTLDQHPTFEVFHQEKSGSHHVHVGTLHAPNPELALILAKEQFGRRGQTHNIWVVKTEDVFTLTSEDSDIFDTVPEKTYRDVSAYMVRNKVEAFKKAQKEGAE
ncbi:MAG: hypothetical protein HQ472_10700 [Ignavibacteria bacterium]|nr:hypothetical protein [Ignavibacteria bacterium]